MTEEEFASGLAQQLNDDIDEDLGAVWAERSLVHVRIGAEEFTLLVIKETEPMTADEFNAELGRQP